MARHDKAFAPRDDKRGDDLDPAGIYQWRAGGERHLFNPITIHKLQKATRLGDFAVFKEYSQMINDQSKEMFTLRGLMDFKIDQSKAIPIEEVEPAEAIMKRFKTGAMSYGSISKEAHRLTGCCHESCRRKNQIRVRAAKIRPVSHRATVTAVARLSSKSPLAVLV